VPKDDAAILTWKARIEEIIVVSASSGRIRMGYLLNRLFLLGNYRREGWRRRPASQQQPKEAWWKVRAIAKILARRLPVNELQSVAFRRK
jgi:hypothetical protein